MRFANPDALWLFLLLPAIAAFAVIVAIRRRRALERFAGGSRHRVRFLDEVSGHRRVVKVLLVLLAAAAVVLAAARPQWGTRLEPTPQRGVDVAIVLDTSLSMAAADAPPSRLGQAVNATSALLDRLSGHRVALVTFAGRATLLCPLTVDHAAAKLFLDSVDVEAVASPGTAMAEALKVALRALSPDEGPAPGSRSRAVVLFSDGEDHEGGVEEMIRQVRKAGVSVHAFGCGTSRGAPIPLEDAEGRLSGYKKDREGRVVTTRLDERGLQALALETGGHYHRATASATEVDRIAEVLAGMDAHETGTVLRVRYEDRFQIPLGVALAALVTDSLLSDRRRRRRAQRSREVRS